MKTANDIAKLFFRKDETSVENTDTATKYFQLVTKKQASWLFSVATNKSKNMNGYMVCSGSFTDDNGVNVFWDATLWHHGAAKIVYVYQKETVKAEKSDTLKILEAMLEAFMNADDELDYSALTQNEKDMIKAQRKAINAEIRMNK